MIEAPKSVKEIFLAALDKAEPADRAAFVAKATGGDAALQRHVEALLQAHDEPDSLLDAPLIDSPPTLDHLATPAHEIPLDFLAPAESPDALGRLGHYEVLEIVGRGGMGVVLRAFDDKLHRMVAIKVMAAQLAASPEARQRFVREAQAAAAVRHDNVVDIHSVEDTGPVPYLVMELIAGISLDERLKKNGLPELAELLRIGLQITEALAAAHRQGLVHRDVKPANILLEHGVQRVKVTDFGLARAVDDLSITQPGTIAGTPAYMSPEQARGDSVDCRSDLFSLGSVLYAMCTGQVPFRASTTFGVLKKVCEESPRPIRELNPYVPDWLANLVENLLAKDPDERYQSATEVADLLSQFLSFVQQAGAEVPVIVVKSRRKRRRAKPGWLASPAHRRWLLIGTAAVLVMGLMLSLTEAGGVTNFAATVIRIITPTGTLVVETGDPDVKVTIEGDGGLVITGAGPQEVRLRPGRYWLRANKFGTPLHPDRELVTISRGDKQIVRVRLEGATPVAAPPAAKPAMRPDLAPFVVIGRRSERHFDTLAKAVANALDGDTIEIRANGPFDTPPISINEPLIIRAGAEFRPILRWQPGDDGYPLASTAAFVLEGLEIQCPLKADRPPPKAIINSTNHPIAIANCRLIGDAPVGMLHCWGSPSITVQNSELLNSKGDAISWTYESQGRLTIDNSVVAAASNGRCVYARNTGTGEELSIRISRTTSLMGRTGTLGLTVDSAGPDLTGLGNAARSPLSIQFVANVLDAPGSAVALYARGKLVEAIKDLAPEQRNAKLVELLTWREESNLYLDGDGKNFVAWNLAEPGGPRYVDGIKRSDFAALFKLDQSHSQASQPRFQGGNLRGRLAVDPLSLTTDDFRLREGSPGYRAAPDGKDLGADVDLVGPGPAYERWKKTPEYQQWLKETGEMK